jgi:hypothetical protein
MVVRPPQYHVDKIVQAIREDSMEIDKMALDETHRRIKVREGWSKS